MRQRHTRFLTGLLAGAALLFVTTQAAVHDIEHDLNQHDEPTCALHLLADHAGKALIAVTPDVSTPPYRPVAVSGVARSAPRLHVTSFRARAPPVSAV